MAFENTGTRGEANSTLPSTSASRSRAGATSGEWNAHATATGRARRPCPVSRCRACSTPARLPETIVCSGELWFAIQTSGSPARIGSTASAPASTAAIVPRSCVAASRIERPRASETTARVSSLSTPASASATYSP